METILLKCGYCGAAIDLDEVSLESRICKCRYCRKTVLIPKDRGQVKKWFNRAEELRAACEFDRAIDVYEKILTEDNTDPQAHWGMALSKCGIEFVLDEKTGEYLPTCHRTTEQTILAEPEYQAALQHAEESQRVVIEAEAQKIHEIQKKILSISRQEQPYDVFISYKEEDEQKNRTKDSVLAQQIYDELKKKNYRVFFARKTLEGKLGTEYEPIIYAALSSAKVMVVVGTKPEHFKATWVRNEWRRFQLMGKDSGKTIIPAYRDMYPDELPPELSALTALDMEKIGFLQELVDSVGRCLGAKAGDTDEGNGGIGRERLAKNGNTFIDLGKIDKAKASFEQMTETYPEDYRGWWGLIECETNRFRNVMPDSISIFDEWYKDAYITAAESKREVLRDRYYDYLRLVSPKLAERELIAARSQIEKHNKEISHLDQQIASQKAIIKREDNVPQQTTEEMEIKIAEEQKTIDKINHEETMQTLAIVFSIGCVFAGFIMFGVGGFGKVLLGILLLFVGVVVFGCNVGSRPTRGSVKSCTERIEKYKQQKQEKDKEAERTKSKARAEIEKLEADKRRSNDIIATVQRYSTRQISDISAELYEKRVSEIENQIAKKKGIYAADQMPNSMSKKAHYSTEEVSIDCPLCGKTLTGNRDDLLAAGFIECDNCGTRISVGRKA